MTSASTTLSARSSASAATSAEAVAPLMEVRGLEVSFLTSTGRVRAVNGLDLDLHPGEIVGLVGESGSGKSVTSRAIMGLLPRRTSEIRGSIRVHGRELVG